jgi:8-oxo-dGTP diphosphatase
LTAQGFVEPVAWHASLPGVIMTAAALIRDDDGRVLVVKPNYRDYWTLPGGICEFGEAPHAGCVREVTEELGLALSIGGLLAVDWQRPQQMYGPRARPAVYFIFDGGILATLADVRLQQEELDQCQFAGQSELAALLAPAGLPRVAAAISARSTGCPLYVPDPLAGEERTD